MRKIKVALAGNPNSGKTSIFNELTGSHQHVGNWPGVTVAKKEGQFRYGDVSVEVVDLPGTYSLSPYSIDERIARDFIVKEKPDIVVVIVDSSNFDRNLYFLTEILELTGAAVVALNMTDIIRKKGVTIDTQTLSRVLKVPIVETVGNKGIGIEKLKQTIVEWASIYRKHAPEALELDYGRDLNKRIDALTEQLDACNLPFKSHWAAVKLMEDDRDIEECIKKTPTCGPVLESAALFREEIESITGEEPATRVIARRYGFGHGLIKEVVTETRVVDKEIELTDKLDRFFTNRYVGIPVFLIIMWLAFQLVFKIGNPLADLLNIFFTWLGNITSSALSALHSPAFITSLLVNGIIGGVGSVVVFLPNIMLLYIVIAFLEDTGYMARAAFVMDRVMHALGLHGKSFIPMVISFGCNIPGILSTRTLKSEKDRILTILIIPLMSCSARLPIYVLFASAFFPGKEGNIIFLMYTIGIVLAIAMARIFKALFFKAKTAPLIMELPPYRMPQFSGVVIHMWERSLMFLKKAGTVILLAVVFIWALSSLPPGVSYASKSSLVGQIGVIFAPLLKPAGFGIWQAAVALVFGFLAKEIVVGTLGTLLGAQGAALKTALTAYFTPLSAFSFMLMSLIYVPCIAAVSAIWKETNLKWALFTVLYSIVLGWSVSVIVYQIGSLF